MLLFIRMCLSLRVELYNSVATQSVKLRQSESCHTYKLLNFKNRMCYSSLYLITNITTWITNQ